MLNLTLSQNRQHVKCNQKTTLFALLEISPDESTQLVKKKNHVVLVIDCSGSMHGQKIEDAKNSAISIVNSLSSDDLISIVTFETNVDVKLNPTPASDPNIENIIRSINIGGGTALYGGIASGWQLVKQASNPNIISRLEVFSDGEPNVEPYDDDDFTELISKIRADGFTLDVFGIGDDYNGPLLMQIAEIGGGKWEHVSDSEALTKMVNDQITVMKKTVIANPQLQLTLMPGSELLTIAITKPTLQAIEPESRKISGNTTYVGLKDIIKDEAQTVAMRIAIPPINGENVSFLTASVTENSTEIGEHTCVISCTNDKELYNLEIDPSPRVILASSEATVLFRKGLEGDQEATRLANTIISSLDDPETTKLMDDDAHATIIQAKKISGQVQPHLSESEKKKILHETTVLSPVVESEHMSLCPDCGHTLRLTSKICGKCGKNINKGSKV